MFFLKNFENIKTHKSLKDLYSEIEVAILYDISKRLRFEANFERIIMEVFIKTKALLFLI